MKDKDTLGYSWPGIWGRWGTGLLQAEATGDLAKNLFSLCGSRGSDPLKQAAATGPGYTGKKQANPLGSPSDFIARSRPGTRIILLSYFCPNVLLQTCSAQLEKT